jgi:hypothetical protein
VIGTATCATYLKCQVYHPALESEWDLQAVPITPSPPPPPPLSSTRFACFFLTHTDDTPASSF